MNLKLVAWRLIRGHVSQYRKIEAESGVTCTELVVSRSRSLLAQDWRGSSIAPSPRPRPDPSPARAGSAPRSQWRRERAFKKASITVKTRLVSVAIGPEVPPLLEAAPLRHRPRPQPGGFDVTTEKVYEASEQISCGKKVSRLGQGVVVSRAGPVGWAASRGRRTAYSCAETRLA